MNYMPCLFRFFLAAIFTCLSACSSMVQPIPVFNEQGPMFEPTPDSRPILVGLAVSGGGSRAATFASGAMEALASVTYLDNNKTVSLLERVNYISSVSGGSLATAYYALNKPGSEVSFLGSNGLTPRYGAFFRKFKSDMQIDFERLAAIRQLIEMRGFNSTKAAYSFSEVWDESLFHNKTFVDIYQREQRGDSPKVIFNGTRWNDGRRFVFTTIPLTDFEPTFAKGLLDTLNKSQRFNEKEKDAIQHQLGSAYDQFRTISFQNIDGDSGTQGDFRNLKISLAVASSASVPGAIGPVTYQLAGTNLYHHIGDGGLFDNQGVESLSELFLHKLSNKTEWARDMKALIIMIDASYPFNAAKSDLDKADTALTVLSSDPFRIQGMMEQRALAYQLALWSVLRGESASFLPDSEHLKIIHLRHNDAKWDGYDDLPESCHDQFSREATSEKINAEISSIPTLLRLKSGCHGALLIKAAHKVVAQNRDEITQFFERHSP